MSHGRDTAPNRRWLDWNLDSAILADSPQTAPTKPTEPGFDGFVGPLPAPSTNFECKFEPESRRRTAAHSRLETAKASPKRPVSSIASEVDCAGSEEGVMSWSEWKAAALNRLFLEQGVIAKSGQITAETVRHGQADGPGRMNA
jgi:hypothetical protein